MNSQWNLEGLKKLLEKTFLKVPKEFYKELENLESIKAVMSPADRKRDNEREMERVLKALIKRGNPLAS